jgi:hypothetical protein
VSAGRLREIATATGVRFRAGAPRGSTTTLGMPRIGLYVSWVASADAGWITYVFDEHGIPFRKVTNGEIRAGGLRDRFDVLVLPDQGASQIIEGHAVGTVPPDYVGGIGDEGVLALRDFVEAGGRLVCNNSSCDLPIEEFRIPVRDVLEGVPADSFNCPGAILKAEFDTAHPLAYGMPRRDMVFFSRGRVFDLAEGEGEEEVGDVFTIEPVVTYPEESLLLSGWMIGDERIRGRAAALDVSYGEGRIFIFGFNVHNRGQARSTLRMFFNALLYR